MAKLRLVVETAEEVEHVTVTMAERRLPEEAEREFKNLIDGESVTAESGETFSCVDPFTEEAWGRVPIAGEADVDRAVRAARRAFDSGGWPPTSPAERAALMRRLARLIEDNVEPLTYRQIHNGKLVSEILPGASSLAADCYFFAGLGETLHGMSVPVSAPNFVGYTVREPIGVVAAITPWNSPLTLTSWKLAPALAAGCTAVVKPSEFTSASMLEFAALLADAGIPPGVVNVVTGYGQEVGEPLVDTPDRLRHDRDSRAAKRRAGAADALASRGAQHPVIARTRREVPQHRVRRRRPGPGSRGEIVTGIFAAAGQTMPWRAPRLSCIAQEIYEDFAARLVASALLRIRLGHPLDPGHGDGAVCPCRAQYDKVQHYVTVALDEGATLLTGGRHPSGAQFRDGLFMEPTVFGKVRNDHAHRPGRGLRRVVLPDPVHR